jgi:hypothetical protein
MYNLLQAESNPKKQEVLGRINHYFLLIRHGPHRKRRVQQFFYCCVYSLLREGCLRSRCVATVLWIYIQRHRLMGGIYELRRWDGIKCHDIYTKFHKYWLIEGDSQTAWWSYEPAFSFQNKEIKLKVTAIGLYESVCRICWSSSHTLRWVDWLRGCEKLEVAFIEERIEQ